MNKEKVKKAIISVEPVEYKGERWVIDSIRTKIINREWHSQFLLFSSHKNKMVLAEIAEVSGGAYL